MKHVIKYYPLILSLILLVYITVDYIDFKKVVAQIEKDNLPLDVIFGGWLFAFSFIIIALFEFLNNHRTFKLIIRIFLTLIFLGKLFSNNIRIEDFEIGIENTTVFSGAVTIILFFILRLKKEIEKNSNNS